MTRITLLALALLSAAGAGVAATPLDTVLGLKDGVVALLFATRDDPRVLALLEEILLGD